MNVDLLGLGIYGTEEMETIIDIDAFSSQISILDYKSVIISVDGIEYEYMQYPGTFDGLPCLNNDDKSAKFLRDMQRRKDEICELLKQGNNVFVILPREQYIFVRTGEKQYSGTGRNRTATNIVNKFNKLSFLPIEIECTNAMGRKISYIETTGFDILKNEIIRDLQYNSYISKGDGKSFLQITNTTKSVGMVFEYEKGNIVLLPDFAAEELYDNEQEWDEGINRSIKAIKQLDVDLKKSVDNYNLPEWTKDFLMPNEGEEIKKLYDLEEKLSI